MDKRYVKVIDPFSEFYERIGVLTGCNGVIYSVDFVIDGEEEGEQTKTVALEKDQFEYVRMSWFSKTIN